MTNKTIACTVLLSMCIISVAQTKSIEGVINQYSRVNGIDRVTRMVTLEDASMFVQDALPDTVLLIQMTGIPQTGNGFGLYESTGAYEFHIVTDVNGSTVTLRSTPRRFDTNELVQMIRVPSYKNADINGTLVCKEWEWEKGTGGILALMVEGTLTFNADIDVSGLGFKGGRAGAEYSASCIARDNIDFLPDYPETSYLAGYKGEGAVTVAYFNPAEPTSNLKGYGPTWNGGGGGNGMWSGGGGGGNNRSGGFGGDQACSVPPLFVPGWDMTNALTPNGIRGNMYKYGELTPSLYVFMGGGGGAGTGFGTAGGNGGGIVIIVAQKLHFNLNAVTGAPAAIKANGGSVETEISEGGAGGGGAGGSILLSVKDYGNIRAEIMGGDGGSVYRERCDNTLRSMGAGGGGSGGYLQFSGAAWPQSGQIISNGGNRGVVKLDFGGTSCANISDGGPGGFRGNFEVQLKGFLNNYIISPSDSLCYGEPVTIQASQPVGIQANHNNYQWQYLSDENEWIQLPDNYAGTLSLNEIKYPFYKDTYLRRIVTSEINDTSVHIRINVRSAIENNDISPKAITLCHDENDFVIEGNIPTKGGGGGPYTFEWEESLDGGVVWSKVEDGADRDLLVSLQKTGGIQSYRRRVISFPGCSSNWNTAVITVQPAIRNEITPPVSWEVCGNTAELLTGPEITGGNGIYDYRWEISTDANNDRNWQDISHQANYLPEIGLQDYGEYFYRRIVASGECMDTSNIVRLRFDRQPDLSEFEIRVNDRTGDLVDDKALTFKFSARLEVKQPPDAGYGTWSWLSANEMLREEPRFEPVNERRTTVYNLEFGMNTIIWKSTNGACSPVSVSVRIEVKDVVIYNGFSPNNDGKNECFVVEGGENATSSELVIFDRYNNVVFKSFMEGNELQNCTCWWDGRSSSGKELPSGTYFYQLILNREKLKKGYVVLKR